MHDMQGLACLVLAHDSPEQLRLLLTLLGEGGARCLVHIDRRASATRRALLSRPLPDGATILPEADSHVAEWGGFGLVRATLALLRAAVADPAVLQVCLISGSHLPVRAPDEIAAFLLDGREHIDLRFAACEPPEKESLRRFWHLGVPGRQQRSGLVRLLNRHSWRLGNRDLARGLRGLTPMVGSQWWSLSTECVREILTFLDANPWYERFFRWARIPDESFFQTLVGFLTNASDIAEPPSFQIMRGYGAETLSVLQLQAARDSRRPFARKFDMKADHEAVRQAVRAARPAETDGSAAVLAAYGMSLIGPAPRPRPGEIILVAVTRNEALRLPAMLAHSRRLGVDRAIIIDNGSTDGTRDYVRSLDWAHLIDASADYASSNFGVDWTNPVLDLFCRDHWVVVADADELLVYPGCDEADLHRFCAHLDATGAEAMPVFMLDCFPETPLAELHYASGDDLLEAAPWFEPPRLRREPANNFPYMQQYGGLRERLFFPETEPGRLDRMLHRKLYNAAYRLRPLRDRPWFQSLAPKLSPNLTKVPLLRWREGARLIDSTHMTTPMKLAADQPTGVLLHFKFLQDFHGRALDAVKRNAHFDGSREYRRYLAVLRRDPRFSLHSERSVRYEGPRQLVSLGLIKDTRAWEEARATQDLAPLPAPMESGGAPA